MTSASGYKCYPVVLIIRLSVLYAYAYKTLHTCICLCYVWKKGKVEKP